MNQKIVTTNLRLPYHQWLDIKTRAAEQGMSFNQFVLLTLQQEPLRANYGQLPKKKPLTLKDLPTIGKGIKPKNLKDVLSEEDYLIYGP